MTKYSGILKPLSGQHQLPSYLYKLYPIAQFWKNQGEKKRKGERSAPIKHCMPLLLQLFLASKWESLHFSARFFTFPWSSIFLMAAWIASWSPRNWWGPTARRFSSSSRRMGTPVGRVMLIMSSSEIPVDQERKRQDIEDNVRGSSVQLCNCMVFFFF